MPPPGGVGASTDGRQSEKSVKRALAPSGAPVTFCTRTTLRAGPPKLVRKSTEVPASRVSAVAPAGTVENPEGGKSVTS